MGSEMCIRDRFECLKSKSASLVIADVDDAPAPKLTQTADWVYLRLRREKYTKSALKKWIEQLSDSGLNQAYVFFKHEDAGTGPKLAQQFLDIAG